MKLSRLLQEERRAQVATAPRAAPIGYTRSLLMNQTSGSFGGERLAHDEEQLRKRANSAVWDSAVTQDINFPHYHVVCRGKATALTGLSRVSPLVGSTMYSDDGKKNVTAALHAAADAVRLSAVLVVAFCVRAAFALARALWPKKAIPMWRDVTTLIERRGGDAATSGPFPSAGPLRPCLLRGHRFNTPVMEVSSVGVGEFEMPGYSFSKEHALAGGAGVAFGRPQEAKLGGICEVGSLAYLEASDGDKSSNLTGSIFWKSLPIQIRGGLASRVNNLIWPESARQVVCAINAGYDLAWFNDLSKKIPELFGTRSVKMHAATIVTTANATYLSTRGEVDLFTLDAAGLQPFHFGSARPPLALGDVSGSDRGPKQVLRVPHAGNEGLIFVMTSPGLFAALSAQEQQALYRWASSNKGIGSDTLADGEVTPFANFAKDYGALFSRVTPSTAS